MENKSKLIYSLALKFNRFKMFLSDSLLPRWPTITGIGE
jgi:hypothetical protein